MSIPDIQEALDLLDDDRPEEALPLLTALAERMPTYGAALALLARTYETTEHWDAARDAWQHAHFLMPNSPAVQEGLRRVLTALAAADEPPAEPLDVDLDLQAELDAELDAVEQASYNPFARPPQSTEDQPDVPISLAEASLALVERALSESEAEAAQNEAAAAHAEARPDEDPYAADPSAIYREIETLISQRIDRTATPPALEDAPQAADTAEEAIEDAAEESAGLSTREEAARRALALEAELTRQEDETAEDESFEDLDWLIHELEAARIVPDPEIDDVPPPELEDDIDDVVSETLARIYASQGQFEDAARVYERLAQREPEHAAAFVERATEMRTRAAEADDAD